MLVWLIVAAVLILLNAQQTQVHSGNKVYAVHHHSKECIFGWAEVAVTVLNQDVHLTLVQQFKSTLNMSAIPVSRVTSLLVLVSLTSMSTRIESAQNSISAILHGSIRPTQCYLFISRHSYLFDLGVKEIPENLLMLVSLGLLRIVYTDNIGPHRKLLPILSQHYHDNNTLIVTVDDDRAYHKDLLYHLLAEFASSKGSSVVAVRARVIGLCRDKVYRYTNYLNWNEVKVRGINQMLLLPVGTGGVLYRPQFFHPVVFSPILRNLTSFGDDLTFRFACMANNITVAVAAGLAKHDTVDIEGLTKQFAQLSINNTRKAHKSHSAPLKVNPYIEKPWNGLPTSGLHRELFESLHAINRQGKNNIQFENALAYLSGQGVIPSFSSFIAAHYMERDAKCYHPPDGVEYAICSMLTCDKSRMNKSLNGPVETVNLTSR